MFGWDFFGPALSFPIISARHHTEGREPRCVPMEGSLWQALKPGMWQMLDAPPSPLLAGDLPLQILEQEWGEQLLLVASFQPGAPSPAPLPSSQPCSQTCILSNLLLEPSPLSLFLGRWISYKTFPPIFIKSLTAAALLSLCHSQHSAAGSGMCPHTAKPISAHYLPLKRSPDH